MAESGQNIPSLNELQRSLRDAFTGERKHADWTHVVADVPPISRAERLAIYANAYFWRLLESMSDDYEATGKSLTWLRGYEFFSELVREYLRRHPSRSEDIGAVGRHFPEFLAEKAIASEAPWLVFLSRFERLYLETFFSPVPTGLSQQSLARLAETGGEVGLTLNASARLFRSDWPVLGIWRKRRGAQKISFPKAPRAQLLLIRRTVKNLVVESLSPAQFQILESLQRGETLTYACAAVEKAVPDPSRLTAWFQGWVSEGLFAETLSSH